MRRWKKWKDFRIYTHFHMFLSCFFSPFLATWTLMCDATTIVCPFSIRTGIGVWYLPKQGMLLMSGQQTSGDILRLELEHNCKKKEKKKQRAGRL